MSRISSRRRPTPWLHRWSRPLIGAIAILGAINTAYITITKLAGGETVCPTGGCEQVLSSPYATVLGLPLALFGFLAYAAMTVFALAPLLVNPEQNKQLRTNLENWTWLLLFIGSTAMLVFSGYLMYIMFTKFVAVGGVKAICYYCLASATFATALFVLTLLGRSWDDSGQLFFTGIVVVVVTLVGTLGIYSGVNAPTAGPPDAKQEMFPVTTTSGQAEIELANYLKANGVKMYGAFWCSHCHEQKQLFGQQAWQAFKDSDYVECSPNGPGTPQAPVCDKKGVQGYPTWEINGKIDSGVKTLQELADLSGYKGPRDFKNPMGS